MSSRYMIDRDRWAKLSIFNQMGNIYSEVGRSFKAMSEGNLKDQQEAMSRAIDLFDTTAEVLIARKAPQSKEVLRAKEEYLAAIYNKDTSQDTIRSLDRYFMQFAVAARLNR